MTVRQKKGSTDCQGPCWAVKPWVLRWQQRPLCVLHFWLFPFPTTWVVATEIPLQCYSAGPESFSSVMASEVPSLWMPCLMYIIFPVFLWHGHVYKQELLVGWKVGVQGLFAKLRVKLVYFETNFSPGLSLSWLRVKLFFLHAAVTLLGRNPIFWKLPGLRICILLCREVDSQGI